VPAFETLDPELRSVLGAGGGPEKTILLGTARTDTSAFDITVCYLRAQGDAVYGVDERHFTMGGLDTAPAIHLGPVTFTTVELTIFFSRVGACRSRSASFDDHVEERSQQCE